MKRRKAREYTVQLVYMLDSMDDRDNFTTADSLIALHDKHYKEAEPIVVDKEFWKALLDSYLRNRSKIDQLLEEKSENWKLSRMPRVDRGILRTAAAEFLAFPEIDHAVTIDEALEIAKRFSTEDSAPFINGILDKLWKNFSKPTS